MTRLGWARRMWVRLDNASNIFLAATSDVDSKVFRLSAELEADVDPELLQRALDGVFDQYVLYHSVLRRGVFWYYLEESDLRPKVVPDELPPCDHLYHFDRRELLFRVAYHRNRIVLEVFHALSDGTGALWVFQDLVTQYIALRHPEDFPGHAMPTEVKQALATDSFMTYFAPGRTQAFADAARPASLDAGSRAAGPPATGRPRTPIMGGLRLRGRRRVHRVLGTRTPDNRTHVVELEMPAEPVLTLAHSHGVSLTAYLTALFLHAILIVDARPGWHPTMAVSVPVDLRQHFPSGSARNFFATTRLEHTFDDDPHGADDGVTALGQALHEQLRAQTTPEALEAKLQKLIGFELNPVARIVPRPLKDLVLGTINRFNNRNLTIAVSNLGRIGFPGPADAHVGAVFLQVSAARPQFCAVSHGDRLTVSFTSPFIETALQSAFVRSLTAQGVHVTVSASKVTVDDLGTSRR